MTHRTRARAAIAIRRGFTRSGTDPWGERPPTVPPARSPSTECAICRKAGKPCDLVRHLIQFERTVRPLEYGNEELSRLGGASPGDGGGRNRLGTPGRAGLVVPPAEFVPKGARTRAVDCLSIDLEPVTHRFQYGRDGPGNDAFGGRADIHQISSALADEIHQCEGEAVGGFPGIVEFLEASGVVNRCGRVPIAFPHGTGDGAVGDGNVIPHGADGSVDQRSRLAVLPWSLSPWWATARAT